VASYPPPPPPGYGPPPGSSGSYSPVRSTHGKAIAALICGIAGLVICPFAGIAAVILGPQAKRDIAAEPQRYDGNGMAQAGQILGWIAIAVLAMELIAIAVLVIVGITTSSSSSVDYQSLAFGVV